METRMPGLWHVETHAAPWPNSHVFVAVWDILILLCLVCCTVYSVRVRSRRWRDLWILHAGMGLLSTWFFFHCIDVSIHHFRGRVTYGYILVPAMFDILRFLSDIAMIVGLRLAMRRHQQPDVFSLPVHLSVYEVLVLTAVLWFLGFYQWGLNLALCFVWLGFANLDTIGSIAGTRSAFDAVYAAVYFVGSLVVLLDAFVDVETRVKFENASTYEKPSYKRIRRDGATIFGATSILCLRSFCEVVIVGQLDRAPDDLGDILLARDICYGLFSAICVIVAAVSTPSKSNPACALDPWDEDKLESERIRQAEEEEAEKRRQAVQTALDGWVPRFHQLIEQRMEQITAEGTKKAPAFSTILDQFRDELSQAGIGETVIESDLRAAQLEEVERMGKHFQEWSPILKGGRRK